MQHSINELRVSTGYPPDQVIVRSEPVDILNGDLSLTYPTLSIQDNWLQRASRGRLQIFPQSKKICITASKSNIVDWRGVDARFNSWIMSFPRSRTLGACKDIEIQQTIDLLSCLCLGQVGDKGRPGRSELWRRTGCADEDRQIRRPPRRRLIPESGNIGRRRYHQHFHTGADGTVSYRTTDEQLTRVNSGSAQDISNPLSPDLVFRGEGDHDLVIDHRWPAGEQLPRKRSHLVVHRRQTGDSTASYLGGQPLERGKQGPRYARPVAEHGQSLLIGIKGLVRHR